MKKFVSTQKGFEKKALTSLWKFLNDFEGKFKAFEFLKELSKFV